MEELYNKLRAIPGSHFGFVMGILNYAKKKSDRVEKLLNYINSNNDLTVSDVVMFVSTQPDFFEDDGEIPEVSKEVDLNKELEKGFEDMLSGNVKEVRKVFDDIRKDYGLD